MLGKLKLKRNSTSTSQNLFNSTKAENPTQGIRLLKNMHAEKIRLSQLPRSNTNKISRPKRSKQPIQNQMNSKPLNPEETQQKKSVLKISKDCMKPPKMNPGVSALTQKAVVEYGTDIEVALEAGEGLTNAENCLKNHAITPLLRAKMVNWMIEVLNTFECEDHTFFVAIMLMDMYYAHATKMQTADDVHLTGIVAMFIASKYVDYYPLKMNIVQEKIGHGTFSVDNIKVKERDMMCTLKYNIALPTALTFVEHMIEIFAFTRQQEFTNKHWTTLRKIKKICTYFGKMGLYEYRLLEHRYFSPLL